MSERVGVEGFEHVGGRGDVRSHHPVGVRELTRPGPGAPSGHAERCDIVVSDELALDLKRLDDLGGTMPQIARRPEQR